MTNEQPAPDIEAIKARLDGPQLDASELEFMVLQLIFEVEWLRGKLNDLDDLHWDNVERFERAAVVDFEGVGTEGD